MSRSLPPWASIKNACKCQSRTFSLYFSPADVARVLATGRVKIVVLDGIAQLSEDALLEVLKSGKLVIRQRFRSPLFKLQRGKWYQKAKSYRNDGGRWVPDGEGAGIAWEFLDDGRVHIYDGDEVDQSYRWEVLSKNEETKVKIKYWSVTSLPDEFATWEFVFASDLRSAEVELRMQVPTGAESEEESEQDDDEDDSEQDEAVAVGEKRKRPWFL